MMLMFVTCQFCQSTVDNRQILDIAQFIDWKCGHCGATNKPIGAAAETFESEELEKGEEITIEHRDEMTEDSKNNILEGD